MRQMMMTGIGIVGIALAGYAQKIDILKPAHQQQEQELRRFMDRLAHDGIPYEVKVEKQEYRPLMGRRSVMFLHNVTVPSGIAQEIWKYDWVTLLGLSQKYQKSPAYSFYMTILIMAHPENQKFGGYGSWQILDAIVNHSKKEWDENLEEYVGKVYQHNDYGLMSRHLKIFAESIPAIYQKDIQPPYRYIDETHDAKKFANPARELERWGYFCLKDIALGLIKHHLGLIDWCRENNPAEKPYLSALMMALFTVDGYSFSDESGVYTMNERGRMLMDFVVEFPIPENAIRLQAVMGGGNKDEIEAMMKKHGTGEMWQELLNTPVIPQPPDIEKYQARILLEQIQESLEGWRNQATTASSPNNAYPSQTAMGMFTDGHSFDEKNGIYIMNERGKILMDFIIEFPVPENATRLQAFMNGGNKGEIEMLMKKFNTEERWGDLLQSPAHPKFLKHSADDIMKRHHISPSNDERWLQRWR